MGSVQNDPQNKSFFHLRQYILSISLVPLLAIMLIFSFTTSSNFTAKADHLDTVIHTMPAGGNGPEGIAFNPDKDMMYVANSDSNTVSVIDDFELVTTIALDQEGPLDVAYNPANDLMYVANCNQNLVLIKGLNKEREVSADDCPNVLAFNDFNDRMYVATIGDDGVQSVAPTDHEAQHVIAIEDPKGIAFNPENRKMYVTSITTRTVHAIGDGFEDIINMGDTPWEIAFNPENGKMYVTAVSIDRRGLVIVIDGTTVQTEIPLGEVPTGIAFNPLNNRMYVTHYGSSTVSVIDDKVVVDTIKVGDGANGIAFNPENRKMYVTNFLSNTISIINPSCLNDDECDFIFNEVDTQPVFDSDEFSDRFMGGVSFGIITDRGDQIFSIEEEPEPSGLRVTGISGGTEAARIESCRVGEGHMVNDVLPGAQFIITCSSATLTVEQGTMPTTLIADDGRTVHLDLSAGNAISFDPATGVITAKTPATKSLLGLQ